MKNKNNKKDLLEVAILDALHHLDSQIARSMLRSPQELKEKGVQKNGIYTEKIETVTQLVLTAISDSKCQLDGLLILSQALSKALRFYAEELGTENLGNVRTNYCLQAFEQIERDARHATQELKAPQAQ